ncbi:MAG: vanadium-dependent haloperoxidase [Pseudomonadota bacterium]
MIQKIVVSSFLTLFALTDSFAETRIEDQSIARVWNEALLEAIRLDTARPTVHARNLFHLSAAMWDTWASYEPQAGQVFFKQRAEHISGNKDRQQAMSISKAAYTLLTWRFKRSLNSEKIIKNLDSTVKLVSQRYGFNPETIKSTSPATGISNMEKASEIGRLAAARIIQLGLDDGSNEANDYMSRYYQPVNQTLDPKQTGNPNMTDPDRWQPLEIANFVGQSGIGAQEYPPFVGPEWGNVEPFSLEASDVTVFERAGNQYLVYFDQGPPPSLLKDNKQREEYIDTFVSVIRASKKLDVSNKEYRDFGPASRGKRRLGDLVGPGHSLNPVTNQPYKKSPVLEADYYRVLAEYWADGPDSETPPGHWFVLLNLVSDQPAIDEMIGTPGQARDRLEWDLRSYLALGGAMHDAAIAAWSHKGWYDYTRPISAIRKLCENGQSSDEKAPRYSEKGIRLEPDLIELITPDTLSEGGEHHHLAKGTQNILHRIAVKTWRGPLQFDRAMWKPAGVDWILCGDWWPYQRHNFVTPPFAGYVSGHSTFSRAAAEVISLLTGSDYFPGGLAEISIPENFLRFEAGPTKPIVLRWATYQDAADDSALSRIYGGIHPPVDDIPGRKIGYKVGKKAFKKARLYFFNEH